MAKYLLIAAVVISLITAGLGFVNRGKLLETREELAGTQTTLVTTRKSLEDSKKQLAGATSTAETATADREKAAAELTAAQGELATLKGQLATATTAATEKDAQIAALTTERDDARQKLVDVGQAGPDTVEAAGPAPREQELEALVASLEQRLKANDDQLASLRAKEESRRKMQMQAGLEGRVLAVNPAWNFVVLSIGDRQGVVNNAELLLKRGGQYLGKVRITSVEPSTSIADIVANTLPSGVAVQPGDSVIYQEATTEN